jgi:hypothetical protein
MMRPIRLVISMGVLTIVAAGCTPGAIAPTPMPDASRTQSLTSALDRARAAFDTAVARSDTSAVMRVLDAGVTLFHPERAPIHGSPDVASALLGGRFGKGSYVTTLDWNRPDLCLDGGVQTATYSIVRRDSSMLTGVDAGGLAVHWTIAGGAAHIDEVRLDRSATAAQQRLSSRCTTVASTRFSARRLEFTIIPAGAEQRWKTFNAMESALNARGFTREAALPVLGDLTGRNQLQVFGRTDNPAAQQVSLGARISPVLRIEGTWQAGRADGGLVTYNETLPSLLTQRYESHYSSVSLVAGWKGLRVGAGPVVVSSTWKEQYDKIYPYINDKGKTGYSRYLVPPTDSTWDLRKIGGVVSVGYVYPITSAIFLKGIAHSRFGLDVQLPGVPTHQNWTASLGASQVGFGFGYAW